MIHSDGPERTWMGALRLKQPSRAYEERGPDPYGLAPM